MAASMTGRKCIHQMTKVGVSYNVLQRTVIVDCDVQFHLEAVLGVVDRKRLSPYLLVYTCQGGLSTEEVDPAEEAQSIMPLQELSINGVSNFAW